MVRSATANPLVENRRKLVHYKSAVALKAGATTTSKFLQPPTIDLNTVVDKGIFAHRNRMRVMLKTSMKKRRLRNLMTEAT